MTAKAIAGLGRIFGAVLMAAAVSACNGPGSTTSFQGEPYLFVWSGDKDGADSDFLAVIDARPDSPRYGDIVATLPVGATGTQPHHTEYEFPEGGVLFANGWLAGLTSVIDLDDPLNPKLARQFREADGYSYPHSYARLENGNVLATFQGRDGGYGPPGGLVEFDPAGNPLRTASAATDDIAQSLAWPYSLAIASRDRRAVVTLSEMGMPPWEEFTRTNHVQIWSTDDLKLEATIPLPPSPSGENQLDPAEPRVMPDGAVYVSTFTCGLYRIDGLTSDAPEAKFVFAFPGGDLLHNICSVPVVVGDYWIQTVPEINGLIALDLSDPDNPVEASRLVLEPDYDMPHWVAADRAGGRLIVTGSDLSWALVVAFDGATGAMSVDESFRSPGSDRPGVSFERATWPHGETGPAFVHGALFGGSGRS